MSMPKMPVDMLKSLKILNQHFKKSYFLQL